MHRRPGREASAIRIRVAPARCRESDRSGVEPATLSGAPRRVNRPIGRRSIGRRADPDDLTGVPIARLKFWTLERRSIDNGWTRRVELARIWDYRERGRRRPHARPSTHCRVGEEMPMGPAEIVASLKELCAEKGRG